jgi:general secretion pathway protein M
MIVAPGTSSSRALAVALMFIVFGAVWFGGIDPLVSRYAQTQVDLERALQLKARLTAFIDNSQSVVSSGGDVDTFKGDFLFAESESVALAELQKQIGAVVLANGSELISAQALPPRQAAGQASIGLRIQLRGALDQIQHIVHAVETSRPFLFIERAAMRAEPAQSAGTPLSGIAAVRLVVELDIVGTRWPSAGTQSQGRRS